MKDFDIKDIYCEGVSAGMRLFAKPINELLDFVKDIQDNYDCDSDAHKYDTRCRTCEAEKLLQKFKNFQSIVS